MGATLASKPGLTGGQTADLNDRLHLAAVVALHRSGATAAVARVLAGPLDLSPRVQLEAARAAYDGVTDSAALASVAAAVPVGHGPTRDPLVRRIVGANRLLGGKPAAERVLNLAADATLPAALRADAMAALAEWAAPDRLDSVTGRLRSPAEWTAASDRNRIVDADHPADSTVARDADYLPLLVAKYATRLLDGPPEVRAAGVTLLAQYGVTSAVPAVRQIAADDSAPAALRVAAVEAFDALAGDDAAAAEIARRALASDSPVVRAAARAVLVRRDPADAVRSLADALASGETVERQQAVATLARLAGSGDHAADADAALRPYLEQLSKNEAPAEITLELLEAAANRDGGGVGEYLAMYESLRGPDKVSAWREALEGGDAGEGAEIFFGRSAVGCLRCHQIGGAGGAVGPRLDGIALTKDRAYLLESVVHPDAKIAEGFATAVILTDDGNLRTGVLRGETDEAVTLVLADGQQVVIPVETILDRTTGASAMPADIPDALTKREMRDLVAFLASLDTPPEEVDTDGTKGGGHEE